MYHSLILDNSKNWTVFLISFCSFLSGNVQILINIMSLLWLKYTLKEDFYFFIQWINMFLFLHFLFFFFLISLKAKPKKKKKKLTLRTCWQVTASGPALTWAHVAGIQTPVGWRVSEWQSEPRSLCHCAETHLQTPRCICPTSSGFTWEASEQLISSSTHLQWVRVFSTQVSSFSKHFVSAKKKKYSQLLMTSKMCFHSGFTTSSRWAAAAGSVGSLPVLTGTHMLHSSSLLLLCVC